MVFAPLVVAAAAKNYNDSKYNYPGAVVVKKMAEAVVIHRWAVPFVCLVNLAYCIAGFPLVTYYAKAQTNVKALKLGFFGKIGERLNKSLGIGGGIIATDNLSAINEQVCVYRALALLAVGNFIGIARDLFLFVF